MWITPAWRELVNDASILFKNNGLEHGFPDQKLVAAVRVIRITSVAFRTVGFVSDVRAFCKGNILDKKVRNINILLIVVRTIAFFSSILQVPFQVNE